VLIECAWAAARSRDSYLSAQYWRLARRIGKKKAAMAVGHPILVIAWHLLTSDCDYADLGGDHFVRRDTNRQRQRAVAQLQALGYRVVLEPSPPNTQGFTFQDALRLEQPRSRRRVGALGRLRPDGSEAGTGTFWQEKLDHVTGPPCRPAALPPCSTRSRPLGRPV
jgi:hypothetical protein